MPRISRSSTTNTKPLSLITVRLFLSLRQFLILTAATGTSHLRAGFASHTKPYINEPNQAAKFTSRKSVKTALYGRDCEVDSAVRPNIKPVFDGDILMTNELLVRRHLPSY